MIRTAAAALLTAVALLGVAPSPSPSPSPAPAVVTAQILDYEKGYVFFTSGDGFRVSPAVVIAGGAPQTRRYARVTFDPTGVVTRIEISTHKLPPEGDLAAVKLYAVALSSPQPNPDLVQPKQEGRCATTRAGKLVTISITVQVPPTTALTDSVYMTSDQAGWNAQAYRLDRVDSLHYKRILKLYSGTVMHVLFDRGSTSSIQVGENGIEQKPYLLCIGGEDAQAFTRTVYRWGDEQNGATQTIPQSLPTPYNPAPFPNLPTPPAASPHPY